jgi:murein DD-endopeptidase MepM/ murein hydrolase activator NlpD
MDPLTRYVILKSGEAILREDSAVRRVTRKLKKGCLLLLGLISIVAFFALCLIALWAYDSLGVPAIETSRPGNIPKAIVDSTEHFLGYGGPLPQEVTIGPDLEALAQANGYEMYLGEFYQVQACIAGAEWTGVAPGDICTIMDMEGWWDSTPEELTFVMAVATARGLRQLGYEPWDTRFQYELVDANGTPCTRESECLEPVTRRCTNATCEAIVTYFAEDWQLTLAFVERRAYWAAANTAQVTRVDDLERYPEYIHSFWAYENLGLSTMVLVSTGITGGGSGEIIVLADPPPVPDDVRVHPYPGSGPTSYNWLQPVIIDGVVRILHPGQDFGRADDYCDCPNGVGHPVVAMSNGEVTFAQMLPESWSLAADWWISGITVVTYLEYPDEPPMCVFYGHGAQGTLQVGVGDRVGAGEQLFNAGTTGFSSDVHLHLAVKRGGTYPFCDGGGWVNPNDYLP